MPSIVLADREVVDTPKLKLKKFVKSDSMDLELSNGDYSDPKSEKSEKKKKEKKKKSEVEEVTEDEAKEKKKKKDKKRKGLDAAGSDEGENVKRVKQAEEVEEEIEEDDPNALGNFRISEVLKERLISKGIKSLFPIQAMTFDIVFDGSDLVGRARTGQGKTLAFVLPILESLTNGPLKDSRKTGFGRTPTVVVLLPTRELAKQVHADFEFYGASVGLSACSVYGGAPMSTQENALRRGVDIVVGTPGRIKDLLNRNRLDLKALKFRILDEADEMLNMGFVDDVEFILGKVEDVSKVQTLLFSATMPDWVKKLSMKFLKADKRTVDLVGNEKMKASASVRHLCVPCSRAARAQLIPDIIRCYSHGGRTIIFTETKESASELAGLLPGARAIHGDVAQSQREAILSSFRNGGFLVLVATNVAARGLDIHDVQLVIQCEPPRDVEAYIHRSGRTGRAGASGMAVLLYEPRYSRSIYRIERESGVKFEHISAPQAADIAASAGSEAAEAISNVSDGVIPIFKPQAEQLLASSGMPAIDMLAKALAKAAGFTDIRKRSLLSSMDDYETLFLQTERPIYSASFVFNVLKRYVPEPKVEGIKSLSFTADGLGAVFDVPADDVSLFVDGLKKSSDMSLEAIDKLPPLQEREESRGGRGGGSWRGGGSGSRFGGGGRGGGGRGGFGGGGRGRGGGGRGRRF